jgi:predicted GIY-YIG superfamily endonuclease
MNEWGRLVSQNDKAELRGCGIYLVFQGRRLLYIGSSINLSTRLRTHDKRHDFIDAGSDSVTLIPYGNIENMRREEIRMIQAHKPPLCLQFYSNPRSRCNKEKTEHFRPQME